MRKVLSLMLFLVILGTVNINSQVRIGGDLPPNDAAVLDLNVDNSDAGNEGGLALPRVALINNTTQLNGTTPTKGMLVYNTKADMTNGQGTGVYYWNGSVWMVVAGEVGTAGTVKGTSGSDYRTWCFPEYTGLGCWTVDNSRETPASGTTYTGMSDGWYGYYYTWAQAAGACSAITGYVLPTEAQWTALRAYINGPNASAIERQHWLLGSALAGNYSISNNSWRFWALRGFWWSSVSTQFFQTSTVSVGDPNTTTNYYFSVRCVKS